MQTALLMLIVLLAFGVQAVLGFGATILTVALGAFLLPVEALLPAYLPLNLALSLYLAIRYRRSVAWGLLLRRIVPFAALGLPAGMLACRAAPGPWLPMFFGVFVIAVSGLELRRMGSGAKAAARPLPLPASGAMLVAGGFIHGIYATGGPMVVYVAGREIHDKGSFRSTLSWLWVILNSVVISGFAVDGAYHAATFRLLLLLSPPLLLGLWGGERLHRLIDAERFRRLLFGLLLVVGVLLIAVHVW